MHCPGSRQPSSPGRQAGRRDRPGTGSERASSIAFPPPGLQDSPELRLSVPGNPCAESAVPTSAVPKSAAHQHPLPVNIRCAIGRFIREGENPPALGTGPTRLSCGSVGVSGFGLGWIVPTVIPSDGNSVWPQFRSEAGLEPMPAPVRLAKQSDCWTGLSRTLRIRSALEFLHDDRS